MSKTFHCETGVLAALPRSRKLRAAGKYAASTSGKQNNSGDNIFETIGSEQFFSLVETAAAASNTPEIIWRPNTAVQVQTGDEVENQYMNTTAPVFLGDATSVRVTVPRVVTAGSPVQGFVFYDAEGRSLGGYGTPTGSRGGVAVDLQIPSGAVTCRATWWNASSIATWNITETFQLELRGISAMAALAKYKFIAPDLISMGSIYLAPPIPADDEGGEQIDYPASVGRAAEVLRLYNSGTAANPVFQALFPVDIRIIQDTAGGGITTKNITEILRHLHLVNTGGATALRVDLPLYSDSWISQCGANTSAAEESIVRVLSYEDLDAYEPQEDLTEIFSAYAVYRMLHGSSRITLNGTSISNPSIYAPIDSGLAGALLVSRGAGFAPEWKRPALITVGSATMAEQDADGNDIRDEYVHTDDLDALVTLQGAQTISGPKTFSADMISLRTLTTGGLRISGNRIYFGIGNYDYLEVTTIGGTRCLRTSLPIVSDSFISQYGLLEEDESEEDEEAAIPEGEDPDEEDFEEE